MGLTVPFIDVSEHQGNINFTTCASQGMPHAMVRAGIGGRYDFKLDRNVPGFRAAGVGVPALYWFINPKSSYSPEHQGDLARQACEAHNVPTMMLDCEWYTSEGGPNPPIAGYDYNQWCWRFISRLGSVRPIIYTSASFWNSWGGAGSDFGHLDTIIASYKWQNSKAQNDPIAQGVHPSDWGTVVQAKPPPPLPIGWDGTIEGWQFSAGFNKQGPVYGMQSSDLDLNVAEPDAMARWYGSSPPPPPPPDPPVPPPPPPPNSPQEDEVYFFKSDDQIHWPGSATLPGGDYGPNNGIYFCQTVGGMVQHVTANMWHVNTLPGAPPLYTGTVPGSVLGGLINEYGIWGKPFTGDVTASVDYGRIANEVRQKFKDDPQR
jgi:hypothetical protein